MEAELDLLRSQHSLRGYRPSSQRVPEGDFRELVGEFSGPRRPLDEASAQLVRDGEHSVAQALGVSLTGACRRLAEVMNRPCKELMRARWCGLGAALWDFSLVVEALERRDVEDRRLALLRLSREARFRGRNMDNAGSLEAPNQPL
jgi:hypothetical protein